MSLPSESFGVITFLDVLGWKGIWAEHGSSKPLQKLKSLVKTIKQEPMGKSVSTFGIEANVIVLSDTIVISSLLPESMLGQGKTDPLISLTIEDHGFRAASAIVQSIRDGIPVRGATNYGNYTIQEQSFIGAAIDEAASWYESTDWIGVHLCPSAYLKFQAPLSSIWKSYTPPFKKNRWSTKVIDWSRFWDSEKTKDERIQSLKQSFGKNQTFTPDVWIKYCNTLGFAKEIFISQEN